MPIIDNKSELANLRTSV